MPAIIESLDEVSLTSQNLTHVAVALGPGGFSAVRVGISAALGLIVSRQLPVLGVPTHDIEAAPYLGAINTKSPLYSLIPAGRNEMSWTRHSVDDGRSTGISAPDDLAARLEEGATLCGEACDLMAGLIDPSQFRGHDAPTRDPNSILDIAIDRFQAGISTPYEELRPIYARPPSISKPKPPK
jgi:tRNA threonylcarbamoyl adenosine modification protein YeaZ